MSEKHYLTPEGAERMREELDQLKGPGREEMAQRLRAAIEGGDLSENADYHKAKEDQGFLEGRIQELEYLLEHSLIIVNNGTHYTVDLGAKITIQEAEYPPDTYLVVGAKEADPQNGRISNESPIGRALMGKKKGDTVKVSTPGGDVIIKLLNVK